MGDGVGGARSGRLASGRGRSPAHTYSTSTELVRGQEGAGLVGGGAMGSHDGPMGTGGATQL